MKIEEAQNLFYERLDQRTAYHNATRELRLKCSTPVNWTFVK